MKVGWPQNPSSGNIAPALTPLQIAAQQAALLSLGSSATLGNATASYPMLGMGSLGNITNHSILGASSLGNITNINPIVTTSSVLPTQSSILGVGNISTSSSIGNSGILSVSSIQPSSITPAQITAKEKAQV
jgi:hypothetical protein